MNNIKENSTNAMTNSHEIISIKKRVPIKSIRIERDYSLGDGITRFSTEYPMELTGKVNTCKHEYFFYELTLI